jgi:hypothetical protein
LHHAICRVLTPLYDKQFIFDSYASRKMKGTHAATAVISGQLMASQFIVIIDPGPASCEHHTSPRPSICRVRHSQRP